MSQADAARYAAEHNTTDYGGGPYEQQVMADVFGGKGQVPMNLSTVQRMSEEALPPEERLLKDALAWGGTRPGTRVRRGQPLFPKKER